MKGYHIAVVGATGAVGQELLHVLERRNFPVASLRPIASARSAGKSVRFGDELISVDKLVDHSFEKIDIAFFCAGGEVSRKYVPIACQADAIAIDNSSVFRMEPHVPLVIPEINVEDVLGHRGLISNPNCTTAIALMALYPLHRVFGVRRMFAASYQAVSGSGARAIDELRQQVKDIAQDQQWSGREPGDIDGKPEGATSGKRVDQVASQIYPHPIAFNVLPHVDSFLDSGYTKEEMKMQNESRKIMHLPEFRASVTCVRVPVYRAHSVAVNAEFERPVNLDRAREVLRKAPGLDVVDQP